MEIYVVTSDQGRRVSVEVLADRAQQIQTERAAAGETATLRTYQIVGLPETPPDVTWVRLVDDATVQPTGKRRRRRFPERVLTVCAAMSILMLIAAIDIIAG